MKRAISLAIMVCACGGGHAGAKGAAEHRAAAESPGLKCIDEADTARNPPTDAPERMDLAHILIRHAGSTEAGDVTRTREEACLRALEARKKLLGGEEWADVYAKYSDSKSAMGGVLYDVTQGSLERKFADTAFSLQVDELSYPVETKHGYHIIWRKK